MTKRQITRDAVRGLETASVPYHVVFLGPLRETIKKHFGAEDLNRAVGNYLVWELPPNAGKRVDVAAGEWLDEWGVRWRETGVNRGYISAHPLKKPDLADLHVPPLGPAQMAGMEEACRRYEDLYLLAWCGDLFERAHFLRGMEDILVDMHENPAFVHGLLDRCLEYCLTMVRLVSKFPVDAIILSDDYGQQHGPIFSPTHFREFIKPRLKVLFDAIHRAGKTVALHSCGDVSAFLTDFLDVGLEVLHPVQPDIMDIHRVKREYGKSLCLYGGVSAQSLIRFGKPAEIRDTVLREKESLTKGGRFILAPTLDLTHDVPLENALAFIDAAAR